MSTSKTPEIPVSVVIATLGNKSLAPTIHALNNGTTKPREILLCLPRSLKHLVMDECAQNVRVIFTDKAGQVAQRIHGFGEASQNYVMQLDDDVVLDSTCLESLFSCLSSFDEPAAIGPIFLENVRFTSVYSASRFENTRLHALGRWAIHGIKPGEMVDGSWAASGRNYGVRGASIAGLKKPFAVDWLPGGCVLHRRGNLINRDFYSWKGKAYAEDLVHSALLREVGVALYVCPSARCAIDPIPGDALNSDFYRGSVRVLTFLRQRGTVRGFRSWIYVLYLRFRGFWSCLTIRLGLNPLKASWSGNRGVSRDCSIEARQGSAKRDER